MLRYIGLIFCTSLMFLLSACEDKNSIISLSQNEIYFFYQDTCSHCHDAAKYIKTTHPMLKIKGLDIKMPGNMNLLKQAALDYKLGPNVGTPLICFGKNYIMGWNSQYEKKFDELAKSYLNESK